MMDEKEGDRSADSRENHVKYYKSLNKIAEIMQREIDAEDDEAVKSHLGNRIDAIKKDKQRIEQMFPEISWDDIN